ncbi:MAG: OadG family protein, partial [Bacteroidaceae bacterium]|nr:OadG family protein [Bacteroidaceae bacterium]
IALFDGNGVDLIDSVTVPVLQPNYGYARTLDKKTKEVAWNLKQPEFVTPGTANISSPSESKIAKLKRDDPYGVGITVLAMGVVFFCLALLYVAFYLLGKFMTRSKYIKKVVDMDSPENRKLVLNISKEEEQAGGSGMLTPDAIASMVEAKPEMTDEIAAVIAQAIKDYQDDVHVEESGVITLIPKTTPWSRR